MDTSEEECSLYKLSAILGTHNKPVRAVSLLNDDVIATMEINGVFHIFQRNIDDKRNFNEINKVENVHDTNKLLYCLEKDPNKDFFWSCGGYRF